MQNILESLTLAQENYAGSYVGVLRYAVPVLSAILLLRCVLPLLTFRREPEIWAWLNMTDGSQIPITHWENVIGRSKSSDVTIDFPTVSRNHAVLTRYDDGSWTITDAGSKDGTLVNGRKVQICALKPKDRISIGGVEMQLQPITEHQEARQAELRTKAASGWDSVANLMMLSMIFVMVTMSVASARRVAEVLNEKTDITNPENPVMEVADGSIEFRHVDFSYKKDAKEPVLKDINLKIHREHSI